MVKLSGPGKASTLADTEVDSPATHGGAEEL